MRREYSPRALMTMHESGSAAGKVTKEIGKKDGGAASDAKKKQLELVMGKGGKSKDHSAFAGGGGSDDEDGGLLEQIKELNMNIKFNVGGEIALPMMAVDRVTFGYPPDETGREQPILFRDVDFGLNMDSRVALVGADAAVDAERRAHVVAADGAGAVCVEHVEGVF